MRLVIQPGSLWLAYDITHPAEIEKLLPPQLSLAENIRLLDKDAQAGPKLLFNVYDIDSLWMRGSRVEIQTIARHREHDTPHLVIFECLSNTMSWDPISGVAEPNALCTRVRQPLKYPNFKINVTTPNSTLIVDGDIGRYDQISYKFSVECNRQCYFGNFPTPFNMNFNDKEISKPIQRLKVPRVVNTHWKKVRKQSPSHVFIHPHRMCFDVNVPGMWYDFR